MSLKDEAMGLIALGLILNLLMGVNVASNTLPYEPRVLSSGLEFNTYAYSPSPSLRGALSAMSGPKRGGMMKFTRVVHHTSLSRRTRIVIILLFVSLTLCFVLWQRRNAVLQYDNIPPPPGEDFLF